MIDPSVIIDLSIIAVTYKQGHLLKCFVESILSQTNENWRLLLIHDGPWDDSDLKYFSVLDYRIECLSSESRFNDWGHSLRAMAIPKLPYSKYTLITNGDNYYIPSFIQEMTSGKEDVIFCDMIHSHPQQQYRKYMNTSIQLGEIDCGAIIVNTDIVKKVGWNSRIFNADWEYIKEVFEVVPKPTCRKVEKTLFVHN